MKRFMLLLTSTAVVLPVFWWHVTPNGQTNCANPAFMFRCFPGTSTVEACLASSLDATAKYCKVCEFDRPGRG